MAVTNEQLQDLFQTTWDAMPPELKALALAIREREERRHRERLPDLQFDRHVKLWYPRNRPTKAVVVELMDVRATDDIRISYDFDRDGWVVEQAFTHEWHMGDLTCDPNWREVAFIVNMMEEK